MENERAEIIKEFGKRLKQVRLSLHMTQDEFGELLGYSQKYISEIERGKKAPTLTGVVKICDKFNLSMDYLVRGKEEHSRVGEVKEKAGFSELQHLYEICPKEQQNLCLEVVRNIVNNFIN